MSGFGTKPSDKKDGNSESDASHLRVQMWRLLLSLLLCLKGMVVGGSG